MGPDSSHTQKTVEEFARLLTGEEKPLLVGGQAVNVWAVWASRSSSEYETLVSFEPFASKDCDVIGDRKLLERLSRQTGLPRVTYAPGQPSFCIGYLHRHGEPEVPLLEVLHGVRGLTPADLSAGATEISVDGKTYRTLSPVTLLKAKIANVHELPQEDRQDVRHVKILVICVRVYISELHSAAVSGEGVPILTLKKVLRRTWDIIAGERAQAVAARHGIDMWRCLPADVLKSSPIQAVRNFCKHRLQ